MAMITRSVQYLREHVVLLVRKNRRVIELRSSHYQTTDCTMSDPTLNYLPCVDNGPGHRMAYWQWGDGQAAHTVVCVHGLSRQGRDFDVLAQALLARAAASGQPIQVICPDVVGRGQSDWLADPMGYQIPQYAADMLASTVAATLEEKLHSWMLPIYDNMEYITHSVNVAQHFEDLEEDQFEKRRKRKIKRGKKQERGPILSLRDLVYEGKVSMEAITFMRGRSIPYQYILIDEVQNLTPHEVKTLVTRVGSGSKIILAGDPYQIDSPYLDFSSNGLVVANERFKGQSLFGSVFLETSERSELSEIAGKLL